MQTFLLFALIIASVVLMVIAISKLKMHPFIVMTLIALIVGLLAAWFKGDLFFVAVSCCATVFLTGLFL